MAEAAHVDRCFTKQVSGALDILGTGVYCNTFSERGKRQNEEVRRFKEAVHAKENEEKYRLFCTELISGISSCIAGPRKSVDSRRVKSYQLFYEKRISDLKSCWDAFHVVLHLAQPDPVWTQTVNRLFFLYLW